MKRVCVYVCDRALKRKSKVRGKGDEKRAVFLESVS